MSPHSPASEDFQTEIAFLGIEDSPSFVREPEGNGVAKRFIRTLKENLLWVRHFETIEELRLALWGIPMSPTRCKMRGSPPRSCRTCWTSGRAVGGPARPRP